MAKKEKQIKENNRYFKEMKTELKKVVWPTPKQLINNTVAVIAFVLIFAIIVFVLDVCFDSINKYGILKLQQKVQSSFSSSESENETIENNETDNQEIEEEELQDVVVETEEKIEEEQSQTQDTPVTVETE